MFRVPLFTSPRVPDVFDAVEGIQNHLDELVTEAETQKQSYVSFLKEVLIKELSYRAERRYRRNIAAAHFPVMKRIDTFDFNRVKGITKTEMDTAA